MSLMFTDHTRKHIVRIIRVPESEYRQYRVENLDGEVLGFVGFDEGVACWVATVPGATSFPRYFKRRKAVNHVWKAANG